MSCLGLAFLPYTGESNTHAILFKTSSSCSGKYSPLYSILPAQASFKRMMVLISVVLPAPLRPMSPVMQPRGTPSVGWEERNRQIFIYFHCAKEGKKLDLITKNGNVCFEADCLAGYKSTGRGVTADYRSLIAFGKAERVYGEELVRGLELLLAHCHVEGYSARECAAMGITAVVRITVDGITGKRRFAE